MTKDENKETYESSEFLRYNQRELYSATWNEERTNSVRLHEGKKSHLLVTAITLISVAVVVAISAVSLVMTFPSAEANALLAKDERSTKIMKVIKTSSGGHGTRYEKWNNNNHGHGFHYEAASWIINNDEYMLTAESPNLIQKYVLALIYFSMFSPNTKYYNSWLSKGKGECEWIGVTCNEMGYVVAVDFDSFGLSGTIPFEISELQYLQDLSLSNNEISGTIPKQVSKLENLKYMTLDGNHLRGNVPVSLCSLYLVSLTVHCGGKNDQVSCNCCTSCQDENEDKQIVISSSLTSSDMISDLYQISPQLADPSSPQFDAYEWLSNVDEVRIKGYSRLKQRYTIVLLYYCLGGENWPYKRWLLEEESECHFPGVGCNDEYEVISITLVSSNLSGTIPSEIRTLEKLEILDLSDNTISGSIPNELKYLTNLQSLFLRHNNLSGTISAEICDQTANVRVDCNDGDSKVICNCCSMCP